MGWLVAQVGSASAQPPPEQVEVHGTVVDRKTNQPVAEASLEIDAQEETAPVRQQFDKTDPQGQFALGLVEGEYELWVRAQGYTWFHQSVRVTARMDPLRILLEPYPQISGRLSRPDGTPLAHAEVRILFPASSEYGRR